MKKTILFISIIIIGGAILYIPSLINNVNPIEDDSYERSNNRHYKVIAESIDSINNQTWNINTYNHIKTMIDAKISAGLLKKSSRGILEHNLNRHYLVKLIAETKKFFYGQCEDREKLRLLNNELKRYVHDKKYREDVIELRKGVEAVYAVAGWDHNEYDRLSKEKLRKRGNYNGLIYKYVNSNLRDRNYELELIDSIDSKSIILYASQCNLLQKALDKNKFLLDSFAFASIKGQIDGYISNPSNFSRDKQKLMVDIIRNYEDLNYWNGPSRDENIKNLNSKLDDYFRKNRDQ